MNKVENFEFFTLASTERHVDKDKEFMYILIRPNGLKIRSLKRSVFYTNLVPIELTINLKDYKVTNNHKTIIFADKEISDIVKFDSTLDLNNLEGFQHFLSIDSKRANKWEYSGERKSQFRDETEKIVSDLENLQRNKLIDKALQDRDKELFDKLTS